jgi:hypothetical protein
MKEMPIRRAFSSISKVSPGGGSARLNAHGLDAVSEAMHGSNGAREGAPLTLP